MSTSSAFERLSSKSAQIFGEKSVYVQDAIRHDDLDITIQRDVDFVDEYNQVSVRTNIAILSKPQLAVRPKKNDQIIQGDRTWDVGRTIKDNGYSITVVVT